MIFNAILTHFVTVYKYYFFVGIFFNFDEMKIV
jgi:hypothetical protein